MSSCIIMGKLFVLINGILNNDRLHMINFIYSFGQAVTQFLFPFLIQSLIRIICFNCVLVLVGALMLHIVPITMLIVKDKISIKIRRKSMLKGPEAGRQNDESRYSDISAVSYDFSVDIKYPSDVNFDMEAKWRNPGGFDNDGGSGSSDKGDNFLQELESHRIMNSEGVEILQTILEGEEDVEIKVTEPEGDGLTDDAIESIYDEINRKHEQQQNKEHKPACGFVKSFAIDRFRRVSTTIYRQLVNPLRRSFKVFKFYPSVILKSCDIFSYLLFITLILPNLALKQYRFEESDRIIYLITLMGACWIVYALLVLRFHNRLKQNFMHYFHIIGLLGKFFGYLCKFFIFSIHSTLTFLCSHQPAVLA